MDYNQLIRSQFPDLVTHIVMKLNKYSEEYQITGLRVEVEDEDVLDLGSYVTSHTSCTFIINVFYQLNGSDEWYHMFFEVPRMLEGIFVINGKYRMLNRYMGEDYSCRFLGNSFSFSFNFTYNQETGLFSIWDEEEEDMIQLTLAELEDSYEDWLVLSEHQGRKLRLKLDLDYTPTKIDAKLIEALNKLEESPIDDIIDKRVVSIESVLFSQLRLNSTEILRCMKTAFYKHGTLSPVGFSQEINKIFYNQSNTLNSINVSPNVNPLSFDSTNQKIILEDKRVGSIKPNAYNETMADIVDPIVTPDNKNVNRINMLNSCVGFSGSELTLKCYDKNWNEIDLDYLEYLCARVLCYEEVADYDDHELVNPKGPWMITVNRKRVKSSTYDYIQASPDERLCALTRSIPMMNMTDSVRLSMAARMLTQAVPLMHPDPPRVQSGYESKDKSATDVRFESSSEGVVLEVTPEKVVVAVNGVPKEYSVPTPVVGIYDVTSVYTPKVKVGDKIKSGDSIITHDISKTGTRNLGVSALVEFRPKGVFIDKQRKYGVREVSGSNYEDGIIVSESFARRLSHLSIVDVELYIKYDEVITSILPIGTKIKSRDILVEAKGKFKSETESKLINLITLEEARIDRSHNLIVPNNIDEGYITDVKIEYGQWMDEESVKLIKNYQSVRPHIAEEVPKSYQAKLQGTVDYTGYAGVVRVRILNVCKGTPGTKLCNRFGSKGCISCVVPDEKMDRTADGRIIDCILNSDAVFSRKNISQVPELELAKVADAVKTRCQQLVGDLSAARDLLNKYMLKHYAKLSDERLIEAINSPAKFNFITGCYSRVSMTEVADWLKELGVDELTKIIDGDTGRPVRNGIYVAEMYMMKLYHLPEHYNKVVGNDSSEDPVLGRGLIRQGGEGQSIGEMEYHALLASGQDEWVYRKKTEGAFKTAVSLEIQLALAGVKITLD